MSTPNYYSQMAPFWNWVAKVEQKGPSHPWFERRAKRAANRGETLNTGADGMAHFWEFVSKVEEQGPSHPWIKRRAANQAKRNAKGGEAIDASEKAVPTPSVDPETPQPRRKGPWGRPKRRQHGAPAEATSFDTSDSEKEVEIEKTLEQLHSEAEKVEVSNENRGKLGAGHGGRGRGRGFGKGRRAAVAADGSNGVDAPVAAATGDGNARGRGMRRGGCGHGHGRGAGMGGGPAVGPHATTRDGNMAFFRRMAFHPRGGPAVVPAPWLNGRGHAATAAGARNFGMGGPHARGHQFGNGLQRGPGAHQRGPRGREGRGVRLGQGRGAAGFARGMNANFFPGPFATAGGPQVGPMGRRPNRDLIANKTRGANAQIGPKRGPQARRFGPMRGGRRTKNGDFIPLVDVFDHSESFMIHASLPGAKKEDIEVNWDAERSVLSITGQMERPGDEELHKTLALKERKVGAFKRNIRLGGKAHPAQVVVEDITARMEDGVLRVKVPKLDAGFVEVTKVDIF